MVSEAFEYEISNPGAMISLRGDEVDNEMWPSSYELYERSVEAGYCRIMASFR